MATAPTMLDPSRLAPTRTGAEGLPVAFESDRDRAGEVTCWPSGSLADFHLTQGTAECWHCRPKGGNRRRTKRLHSWRTTLRREALILRPPLYSMKPSFLNLFMKKFTRERVVPIISASISCESFGNVACGRSPLP